MRSSTPKRFESQREIGHAGFRFPDYFRFGIDAIRHDFFDDETMLEVKQRIHRDHRTNPETIVDHLLQCLDLRGRESILDLGCGNGFLLAEVAKHLVDGARVVGLDIAPGILRHARRRFDCLELDAVWVEGSADDLSTFEDDGFDRVMANYMVHYVPDLEAAFAEVRRVLRIDGRFVATTDSVEGMGEMYQVHFDAVTRLGWPEHVMRGSPKHRFSLENGAALLGKHFPRVEVRIYTDQLRFETPEPFMEFYAIGHRYCSARAVPDPTLTDSMFSKLHQTVEETVRKQIEANGAFVVSKRTGSFVCSAA